MPPCNAPGPEDVPDVRCSRCLDRSYRMWAISDVRAAPEVTGKSLFADAEATPGHRFIRARSLNRSHTANLGHPHARRDNARRHDT